MTKKQAQKEQETNKSQIDKTHPIQKKENKAVHNVNQNPFAIKKKIMAQINKIFSINKGLQNSQIKSIQEAIDDCFDTKKVLDFKIVFITGQQVDFKKTQIKKILLKKSNQKYKIVKIPIQTQLSNTQVIQQSIMSEILGIKGKTSTSVNHILKKLHKNPIKQKIIIYIQDIQKLLIKKVNDSKESVFNIFNKSQKLNMMLFCVSHQLETIKERAKLANFQNIIQITLNPYSQQEIIQIVNSRLKQIQDSTQIKVLISEEELLTIVKKCMFQQKSRLETVFLLLKELFQAFLLKISPSENQKIIIQLKKQEIDKILQGAFTVTDRKIQQIMNLPLFHKMIFFALFLQIKKNNDMFSQKGAFINSARPICQHFQTPYTYNFVNDNLNILIDYGFVQSDMKNKQILRLCLPTKDLYKAFIKDPIFAQLMEQNKV